ncbi:MAG TPA: TonB family protein [Burkholderiales bacterium]|nr:TonB family protein [Burkholderiales bacterium]
MGNPALWADLRGQERETLPFWRAALIALGLEIIIPFLVFGVDWSFLPNWEEPPPEPVMSVRLEEPPPPMELPPPEPEKKKKKEEPPPKKKVKREKNPVPIVPPKPLPNEVQAKVELPKPEPKPQPEPPKEEKEPEPEPPPLPSVFRDVKPVKKVKPKYPREAEDAHIQGRVRVRLTVEVNGSVSDAKILLSEPPGVFDAAVMEAVVQYIFKRDGTSYQADQEILFKLDE